MLPLFGDERRRNINLGGASSASTQAAILDQAKQLRNQRNELKRQHENAVILQAWWRGIREARLVRNEMRRTFESNVMGITGMRCLVLIGQDEEALGIWSNAMLSPQNQDSFDLLSSNESWVVLVRQLSLRLLLSVATTPQSSNAESHLKVLTMLTQSSISAEVMRYLLSHGGYGLLSRSFLAFGLQSKNSPQLPLLVPLLTVSFQIFPPSSPEYLHAIIGLFSDILTISLLPNRMPIRSLTLFSSTLPFTQLSLLEPHLSVICTKDTEPKVNLVANLLAFTPPRYAMLQPVFSSYLSLLTVVLNSLPVNALDPPAANTSSWSHEDSDDEDNRTVVSVVTDFNVVPLPTLDSRTMNRLQTLPSPAHLSSIIANCRSSILTFILSLTSVWPTERGSVLTAVLTSTGTGFLRELYRGHVRSSPIGKDDNPGAVMDPAHAGAWPSLLLLADLYTQALLTMGDDEFFDSSGTRNPLTLDDLTSFSRQLLIIAFTLYWRDDQTRLQKEMVCPDVRCTWEGAREKVTKCLLAIHSRDSRKPFVPPEHWLVGSQIDMNGFIEAAVYEEQALSDDPVPTKAPTKRQMAHMSPRLGVLNNIPFAIPFDVRVSIFRNFVLNDSRKHGDDLHSLRHNRTIVSIRRDHIAEDGFDKLGDANLKGHVQITFIDKFGEPEAGIDGGGVFKEFFTSLCKEVFDTDRGLWLANKNNELYPNPHGYAKEGHSLSWYRFIGRILGKAIYEGILVDVAFAGFFLAKWLGRQNLLDDLASLDPELYNGLMFLKHYTGNPEDLSLNFTVAIEEFGVTKTMDLIPGGSTIAVTRENRLQYIYLVSHYRLSKQIKLQSEAFFEGLSETIDPKWLRMFNQQEAQILIGGVNSPIDLEDLRENTNYGGLYDNNEPTIVAFWKVVETFDQDQRRALLRFVTSCSRPPLLGFKELVPKFGIRDSGSDEHRLPTASTCFNLLKLPRYQSEKVLKDKLLRAITSGAGFDLS